MLSIVSRQEADGAEHDREEFEAWYADVRANNPLQVCVWRQEASSSRYVAKVEKYVFSQRFLEANAIIIQTFFRLRRMGVPREHRYGCHRLLYRGQTLILTYIHTCTRMYMHTYIHSPCIQEELA